MRKGVQALYVSRYQVPVFLDQLLRDVVDTAHCGDNPKLVADANLSAGAAEALKGMGGYLGQVVGFMTISVFPALRQPGAYIVDVDPLARSDVLLGQPNGTPIFYDLASGGDGD